MQGEKMLEWFKAEGGLYPKMGQILAQRGDVEISEAMRERMRGLQDDCEKMDFSVLPHQQDILEWIRHQDLGKLGIDQESVELEPIAAGSTAQVHGLGRDYVMKVMLPGNKDKMESQFS